MKTTRTTLLMMILAVSVIGCAQPSRMQLYQEQESSIAAHRAAAKQQAIEFMREAKPGMQRLFDAERAFEGPELEESARIYKHAAEQRKSWRERPWYHVSRDEVPQMWPDACDYDQRVVNSDCGN